MKPFHDSSHNDSKESKDSPPRRHSPKRLKQSKRFERVYEACVYKLKELLTSLVNKINASGGGLYLSMEKDILTAGCGNAEPDFQLGATQEASIFAGESLVENDRYIHPVQSNGHVVGYVTIRIPKPKYTDITEELVDAYSTLLSRELELEYEKSTLQKYSERLLEKKKKLEKTQRYNSNILSITTHDLASPLNAVAGYLDLMNDCLEDDGDTDTDRMLNYHKHIQSGVRDISDMVSQLNEIAQIERGLISLEFIKTDLNWVVSEVCELLVPSAKKKGVDLQVKTAADAVYAETDVVKMRRVIYNLVSNAMKYTTGGGHVHVSVEPKADDILVHIKDDGIGIAKEKVSAIFEPFVKLNNGGGKTSCGLGLFISSYFVNLMNGSIVVNSEPNKGSTFTVILPQMND